MSLQPLGFEPHSIIRSGNSIRDITVGWGIVMLKKWQGTPPSNSLFLNNVEEEI